MHYRYYNERWLYVMSIHGFVKDYLASRADRPIGTLGKNNFLKVSTASTGKSRLFKRRKRKMSFKISIDRQSSKESAAARSYGF